MSGVLKEQNINSKDDIGSGALVLWSTRGQLTTKTYLHKFYEIFFFVQK